MLAQLSWSRVSGLGGDWRDRAIASDPGLVRLYTAGRALVGVGSTMAIEYGVAKWAHGVTLVAMILGAVIGMIGANAVSGASRRDRVLTLLGFPVAASVGMGIGTAVGHLRIGALVTFILVMFVAVWIRQYGPRFFIYGMLMWLGYFFSLFLRATYAEYPSFILVIVVASAWTIVLALIEPDRPEAMVRRAFVTFQLRIQALAEVLLAMAESPADPQLFRRVHAGLIRINEAALVIEGLMGSISAARRVPLSELRRVIVDAELEADHLADASVRIVKSDALATCKAEVENLLQHLSQGQYDVLQDKVLKDPSLDTHKTDDAFRDFFDAMRRLLDAFDAWDRGTLVAAPTHPVPPSFSSQVTLMGGALPGTAGSAKTMIEEREKVWWNPFRRWPLTLRQGIQVAVSTGLAIIIGQAISEKRYYWAVIAVFIAFTGTATVAETVTKAVNRVIGTVLGLVAAIIMVHFTEGHTGFVLAVILASMFLGLYLMRVSYAFMIFFITVMVAQMYAVLAEFSGGLMLLRLEETAVGAGITIIVALLVFPTRTKDTAWAAQKAFLDMLVDLLKEAQTLLLDPNAQVDLDAGARALDLKLYVLVQATRPIAHPTLYGPDGGLMGQRLGLWSAIAHHTRGLAQDLRTTDAFSSWEKSWIAERCGELLDLTDKFGTPHPILSDPVALHQPLGKALEEPAYHLHYLRDLLTAVVLRHSTMLIEDKSQLLALGADAEVI